MSTQADLSRDLIRRPHFIQPFLLGCQSKNGKLVTISVPCLQRLVASRSIPREKLKETLDSLRETTATSELPFHYNIKSVLIQL